MKKRKRTSIIFKICMSIMAIVQMIPMTTFAIGNTDKGNVIVNGVEDKVTVNAYQMMDVQYDYEVDQPQNLMYQWREEAAGWVKENFPAYIDSANENEVKKVFSTAADTDIAEFYDRLAVAIKMGKVNLPVKSVIATGKSVTVKNLAMGNYFILIEGGVKVYRPLTANVVPEWKDNQWKMTAPVVMAKASEPSITKTVMDEKKKDNLNIGDTVTYELHAVVPNYPKNAIAKKYVISDRLSEGLTLDETSIKVYGINSGVAPVLISGGYAKTTQRPEVVSADREVSFSLDFNYASIEKYAALKISYTAVLNEKAIVGEEGNRNQVYLDYNNNPYVENSWKTDEDETSIYTYGLKVLKVDEETEEGLSDAQFTLSKDGKNIRFTGENGNYTVVEQKENGVEIVKSGKQGMMVIRGLDAGNYVLTEVKAPEGYVKLQNPIDVTITDENLSGNGDGFVSITVKNDKGFILPVTGGNGTFAFTVSGIVLVCIGGVLIAAHLRKKTKK